MPVVAANTALKLPAEIVDARLHCVSGAEVQWPHIGRGQALAILCRRTA